MDPTSKESPQYRPHPPPEATTEAQAAEESQMYAPPQEEFSLSFVPRHMRTRTVDQARHHRTTSDSCFLLSPNDTPEFSQGEFGAVLNTVDPEIVDERKPVDKAGLHQPEKTETALPVDEIRPNIEAPIRDSILSRPSSVPQSRPFRPSRRIPAASLPHSSPPPIHTVASNLTSHPPTHAASEGEPPQGLTLPPPKSFEGEIDDIGQNPKLRHHRRHSTRTARHIRSHSQSQGPHLDRARSFSSTSARAGISKASQEHRHGPRELQEVAASTAVQPGPASNQFFVGSGPGPPSWTYDEATMGANMYNSPQQGHQTLGLGIAMAPPQQSLPPPQRMYFRESVPTPGPPAPGSGSGPMPNTIPGPGPAPTPGPRNVPIPLTGSGPGPGPSSTSRTTGGGQAIREEYPPSYSYYSWSPQREAQNTPTPPISHAMQQHVEHGKPMSPSRLAVMSEPRHEPMSISPGEGENGEEQLMTIPGNDYDGPVDTDWTSQDEEELFKLLDTAERFKWKYISDELSEQRMKRIPARACHLKFQALFGETESMSALKSSLFYVAYRSGWRAIKQEQTRLELASSSGNPEIRHEFSGSPTGSNSSAESGSEQAA